ncbi:MAG: AN1-type zinc finger domain-containing protein [Candidatus Thermoplasmatota archaeon]|nr:AN1-type zinc finger domain-containing protein [Candidatus Thermoplasmatota archaeon]
MSLCDVCDEGIRAVPYKCRRCGQTLCPEHRLLEYHSCEAQPQVTEAPRELAIP